MPDFVFDSEVSDGAKILYAYLLRLLSISEKNGNAFVWPSADKIGKDLHVKPLTAKRRLYELEDGGFIRIERRKGQTSKIFLTRIKNDTSTSIKNDTGDVSKTIRQARIKNDTQVKSNKELDKVSYTRTQKRKNHNPSYDAEAYEQMARNFVPVYVKKEDQADGDDCPELPF